MNLIALMYDLRKRDGKDRNKVLEDAVNERLMKSLNTYYKELANSSLYLYARDNVKVMRQINEEVGE